MREKSLQIIKNIRNCEGNKKLHCDILLDAYEDNDYLVLQRGFMNWRTMAVNRETITKIKL